MRGLGPAADEEDVMNAVRNPEETRKLLMFPGTQWEFYRWNRQDALGFLFAIGVVVVVLGVLYAVVNVS